MTSIQIPWREIVYDTACLNGAEDIMLFHTPGLSCSTEDLRVEEKKLVEFLVDNHKDFLLGLFELDKSWHIKHHVIEPFAKRDQQPGDIDILIFNPKVPNKAIAVEVKVFKKRQENFNNNFIDNLDRMREGLLQAEGFEKMGFHSVFILPIIIANTSVLTDNNLASRVVDESNWGKIRNRYVNIKGNKKIGLVALEICQNSVKPLSESGVITGFMFNQYKIEQSPDLTEKIRALVI